MGLTGVSLGSVLPAATVIPDSCFSPPCTGSRGQRVPECGPAALPAASACTGQPVCSGGASDWGCTHLLQRHPNCPAERHQVELLYLWPATGREALLPKGSHILLLQLGEVVGHRKSLFSLPSPKSHSQWFLGTAALQHAVLLPQRLSSFSCTGGAASAYSPAGSSPSPAASQSTFCFTALRWDSFSRPALSSTRCHSPPRPATPHRCSSSIQVRGVPSQGWHQFCLGWIRF